MLEELRSEAVRQAARKRSNHQTEVTNINASTPQIGDGTAAEKDAGKVSGELGVGGNMDFDLSPSDAMADMTSWEQFDSIVSVELLAGEEPLYAIEGKC